MTSGLRRGGAEGFLVELLRRLPAASRRVTVVSLTEATPLALTLTQAGIQVVSLGLPRLWHAGPALIRTEGIVRQQAPDVVLGWMYHGNLAATWCARRRRIPVVWSIHSGLDEGDRLRWHAKWAVGAGARWSADPVAICYTSSRAAARHQARGYHAGKALAIPTGVDPTRFRPSAEERRRRRRELGLSPDAILIAHFARFHPVKDQRVLVAGVGAAARRRVPVHLLMAGDGLDPGNRVLARWIATEGLQGRVIGLGPRDDVPEWLAACDLAVLTSRAESSPLALLEAMATELPCIATEVGACAELIDGAGVVVPTGNPGALADAITGLFEMGASGRARLGRLGRARVMSAYGIDQAVGAYHAVLAHAAGTRAGPHPAALSSDP